MQFVWLSLPQDALINATPFGIVQWKHSIAHQHNMVSSITWIGLFSSPYQFCGIRPMHFRSEVYLRHTYERVDGMLKHRPPTAPTAVLGSINEDIGIYALLVEIEHKLQMWEASGKWVK